MSHREIARDLKISHSAVTRIINLHKQTGSVTARRGRGRHPVTSQRTDLRIHREVLKDPFVTARQIKERLPIACDKKVVQKEQQKSGSRTMGLRSWSGLVIAQASIPLKVCGYLSKRRWTAATAHLWKQWSGKYSVFGVLRQWKISVRSSWRACQNVWMQWLPIRVIQ